MTLQEKRQQLRDLIPTSKELTVGCEVFIQNYCVSMRIVGDNRGNTIHEGTEFDEFLGSLGTHTQPFKEKHIESIIGHPPAERDLLRVLNDAFCGGVYMGTVGIFHYFSPNVRRTLCNYDLTADPLSQDEETTDKLLKLLK